MVESAATASVVRTAMGEAAGRAAKQAVRRGVSPEQVDVDQLQEELRAKGAYLREPEAAAVG
jgi:hypothetical protein